ncbi:M20/M25/M40 family metallo-hydrolase [Sandaracinobacteroides saxicola]|uniref:M20/M25/M40 family metallo-hydrolase n=1 Tax=Sandaracinobacteroides saxicola TaxID=2759707 RepID=A0A7G5IGD9_9SPHN|nr:M20/M25/M40 family metallo-hydrolase [Sandaracinobacteroides saxicola]QMW22431.1 M20/M25/M40 family metallo-hydrolase [Sandaracinobacteroides saxicola]
MKLALAVALLLAAPVHAAPGDAAQAKEMLKRGIAFDTVKGRGKVPAYADYLKTALVAGGFAASDVAIDRHGETATLHLVWRGSGKKRPFAITGHMDVVEANPKDWVRDPFTPIEEDGFVFGRGSHDNKFDVTMAINALIALKSSGFKPNRDIHLFLSGDEETDWKTTEIQARAAKAAGVEFMLNTDNGGGTLDENLKPVAYNISAAEKTYADFKAVVTNPGGHSSLPTWPNAIAQLAAAAVKIDAYRFAPQINEITRASLTAEGRKRGGRTGAAMLAFVANPADPAAIATLRADPWLIGQISTTCIPTMVSAGHAENALPQRATMNINCRIFPGVPVDAVRAELEKVVADPAVKIGTDTVWLSSPASPLRADVMAAVAKALAATRPGLTAVPAMDAGASDSVWYRALGIPSFGTGGLFVRENEVFIHGLNERVRVASIAPAVDHWRVLISELAR